MDKLKMHSPNLTEANIEKLAQLFPNCVTEATNGSGRLKKAIDFDLLRQELSEHVVEGPQERYQLNWPGKREALLTANLPIARALRPFRSESVNFLETRNLFIEGDNLEALKLIQEVYLGKVKMIYIDPPYNTGSDFIYNDDFSENINSYLLSSNQKTEKGGSLTANTESNGRFHSAWISMMYSRLKLARNLLCDDGVIFISLDDGEISNLRKICDEIFGEDNFVANVIWQKKFSRSNDAAYFSTMHDNILCYAKNSISNNSSGWKLNLLPRTEEDNEGYSNPDSDHRGPWTSVVLSAKSGSEKLKYTITTPSGRKCAPPDGRYWSVNEDKFSELVKNNRIWFGKSGDGTPRLKTFLSEVQAGLRPNTIWFHDEVSHNQEARQSLKKLFDGKALFDSPKPVSLLKRIISITSDRKDGVYLDFFSGSSTTAHAVMEINAEDSGSRRHISIQIPENLETNSDAFKAGYKNIAEISKERIRLAGKKIKEENAGKEGIDGLDIGFRVLKIDTSNMKEIYYTPDAVTQDLLFDQVDNVREDRTHEDLLFQVLLDWGVDLTLPIRQETIADKQVYFVDGNALVACFDKGIDEAFVKQIAEHKPLRVVFRDNGFASDSTKINVEQLFKLLSPITEVKTL